MIRASTPLCTPPYISISRRRTLGGTVPHRGTIRSSNRGGRPASLTIPYLPSLVTPISRTPSMRRMSAKAARVS